MEDRHCIVKDIVPGMHLIGVYDGHGGCKVSDLCAEFLPEMLVNRLYETMHEPTERVRTDPDQSDFRPNLALKLAIKDIDGIAKRRGIDDACGTTFCAFLVQPSVDLSKREGALTVANIGDSRLVMKSGDAVYALTKDHNTKHARERTRVFKAGGSIIKDPYGTDRVMGTLNMTRSLGDRSLRPFVSPHPVVSKYTLRGNERYIIIGTDGLWDVLSNQDAMLITDRYFEAKRQGGRKPHNVARELVNAAIARGSTDNITAIWATWSAES